MSVLSTLSLLSRLPTALKVSNVTRILLTKQQNVIMEAVRKMSDERKMHITPTRFQYTRFKDDFHFYITLGIVPLTLLILYVNIFIGPATLTETPEDYQPRHWEYHRHPITRFIAKNFHLDPQIHYEKTIQGLVEEEERGNWMRTIDKVNKLMGERDDYKAWYYLESEHGRQIRYARYENDKLEEMKGYK
ncbi:NADH dehydrogenase [ubiquinone] 1 beta subcomplex subunit 5, mitochondrial [Parasteatoda tepidariorum]|nr:NADH dehydrogenase [ubiquinone] 1 beta subcomplex subunit 5, mitochondrial [Parasteatoda tepidariorum]